MVALLDRPDVQAAIGRELARRELAEFCRQMDPGYEPARHAGALIARLEAVERGDVRRLAVFMPPRHSKTYHVSERFPAWFLGRNPGAKVILASYGAELAEGSSRKVRNLLADERWPFRSVGVAQDSAAANRWATTHGGEVIAAGVGGAMTGFGADLLLIDDPVKGRAEADSETYREAAWDWYTEVARTRLMPGGRIVLCMTRWHEADLAGRLLARGGWDVLSLPAVAEDGDDALGRAPGEPLWPSWYDAAALAEIRADLTREQGARGWWALYQQRPTADEGGLFRRAWMQRRGSVAAPLLRVVAVDAAFKAGVGSDYSALAIWETDGVDYGLSHVERGRWEYPDLRAAVLRVASQAGAQAVLIEDTAAGQSVIQELQRTTGLPIVPVKVTASKEARAGAVSPLFEAGKVVLDGNVEHLPDWIDEHAAFPHGRHDDLVDTTSMALAYLRDMAGLMLARARGPVVRPLAFR